MRFPPASVMRLWRLKRMVVALGAMGILGFVVLFLSGSKTGLTNLNLLESAQIDRIERFKQKMKLPIVSGRNEPVSNESCVFPNGNLNTSLGPKIPLHRRLMKKLLGQSRLPPALPFPATESLFDDQAISEAGLPFFRARIPAMVYHKGSFLAFSEARFDGPKDFGNIQLVMRRGDVRGQDIVWQKIKLIVSLGGFRTNNPSPIVDTVHDSIVLIFSGFPTELSFNDMMAFPRFPLSKMYVMKSYDLGDSWTALDDISAQTVLKISPVPVLLVPGPGHSIQLKCGRIVVPCNYFTLDRRGRNLNNFCQNCSNYNRIVYSDDGGNTWSVGEKSKFKRDELRIPIFPNEVMAVEVDDNLVSLNSRTLNFQQPRAVMYSFDGGISLSAPLLRKELIEPGWRIKHGKPQPKEAGGCQAAVIGFPAPRGITTGHKTWVIFSNPADRVERHNLALRLSIDACQTWSAPFFVHDTFAAYSDISYFEVKGPNGTLVPHLALVFEGGRRGGQDFTQFRAYSLASVLQGLIDGSDR